MEDEPCPGWHVSCCRTTRTMWSSAAITVRLFFVADEDYQRYLTDRREHQGCLWVQGVRPMPDDQSRASSAGAWRVHDWLEPTDESAGRSRHALSQPAGGALRYALGKPLQIQRGADGDLSAGLFSLYRTESGPCPHMLGTR